MAEATTMRCVRCYVPIRGQPHLMAGRPYCCTSCSVGSACEHQGVRRAPNVRRYDTMFDRFREAVRMGTPFETDIAPRP
ncbi:MAG: hypothetical protein Kow0010_09310 [Dehalococcoidia bacterium]